MDRFNLEMTVAQLVEYVRKCPKQFAAELPDKLEKYISNKFAEYLVAGKYVQSDLIGFKILPGEVGARTQAEIEQVMSQTRHSDIISIPDEKERKALRTDMALKILGNQNIHITTTPEHLANYVVELADAILNELDKTP